MKPDAETMVLQWTFKTDHMRRMAVEVTRTALARGVGGEFSALNIELHGADEHGGTGIAGSIFRQLMKLGIICPVGTFIDGKFIQRRVRNAGGNPIGVWRLDNRGLARALLRAHGSTSGHSDLVQGELSYA